ncbi:MAG: alpha/beta fold hydrolase [Verrucomicrobiota bacterium]
MFGDLKNQQGETIDYAYTPGADGDDRIVVLGHGVTGNKDRPVVVETARALNAAGIATLCMSFAGNGNSGGRFEDCTISKEVDDLGSVLDALGDRTIAYAGHSMGGAVGVLRANRDPRIKVLISIAGMVHTEAFADREFGEETPGSGCMWEEESCPLSTVYVEDMASIHSVLEKGGGVKVPWLLIHGTEDDVVPIQDSLEISARANEPFRMVQVEGADHSFNEHHQPLGDAVVSWVQEHLR